MYDIIGDIHGHADKLEELLLELGYKEDDGVYQHPERTLISVGDLIDRGPYQKRSVDIIRKMCERGDVSPKNRTMTSMRFPLKWVKWRSRYEKTLQRRTNHQGHQRA